MADEIVVTEKCPDVRRPFRRKMALVLVPALLLCAGITAVVEIWPSVGAQAASRMRDLVGPLPVAWIETVVFRVQDTLNLLEYQSGVKQAMSPWGSGETSLAELPLALTAEATPPALPTNVVPSSFTATETPVSDGASGVAPAVNAGTTPTATRYVWRLPTLVPFDDMEGEGVWLHYLDDGEGNAVAARTFLQPDPKRPYAIVAVVAFDLSRTRLHFVLGYLEPSIPGGLKGDGLIPDVHRQPGVLLAAFNGGFKAIHGQFGAMANGIEALPPKDELATVGIYQDGEVQIGSWGDEINASPDLLAFRQTGRLVIQDGAISPRVYNDSIADWGGSVSSDIVTRCSGLGLDREAKTVYYFAGGSLSMPVLADAMLAAGVHNGMLLDINNFWVHFTAIRAEGGDLIAEPLLPHDMREKIDRYLGAFAADFFYVTLR